MLLASMQEAAHVFVEGIAQSMAREGATDIGSLPAAVYAPFQPQLDRLPILHVRNLSMQLDTRPTDRPTVRDQESSGHLYIGS